MGNIIEMFENGRSTCRYEYDSLGRLTREDNVAFGKTTTWAYDNNGNTDSIEFIAVDKDCRGKNIAGGLLEYIAQNSSKNRFVLEVASSNTSAIRAYEKFGFVEFFTINLSSKEQKYAGFEKYIYMEYIKQSVPKK